METKLKLNANTVLCRLRYENGYLYEGEIMETYLPKGQPPKPLVYEKWPDRRICGYGKLTQPGGKVVMSTSYGLADSVYYIYDEEKATDTGKTVDGAPLYSLDTLEKEFTGPAMGEDLDYYEGKILTLTESASDKYIFGKFFFADKIVALSLEEQ